MITYKEKGTNLNVDQAGYYALCCLDFSPSCNHSAVNRYVYLVWKSIKNALNVTVNLILLLLLLLVVAVFALMDVLFG